MSNPLEAIQQDYFINFWESKTDNPKAPIINIVLKHKQSGEQIKYPVWRDKGKGYPYLGKPEPVDAKPTQRPYEGKVTKDVAGIPEDLDDNEPPF